MAKKTITRSKVSVAPKPPILSEVVPIGSLKNHPKNYRKHGADQIAHIKASIKKNGFYKNVVVASDGTILAGHGAVIAAKELSITEVPIVRLPFGPDDQAAMKILTGDNEIGKLAEVDDRVLSEILKDIASINLEDLLGTGFDDKMLANLVFVTRNANEIKDFNAAAEWVGMPVYDQADETKKFVIEIEFVSEKDRDKFVEEKNLRIKAKIGGRKWSTAWPYKERNDPKSVRFEDVGE